MKNTPLLVFTTLATFMLGCVLSATAQTGISNFALISCDDKVQTFLNNYGIPGATVALSKNGRLVYMRAFGKADQAQAENAEPYNLFRIASLSKPITAISIMKLVEGGLISLDDKVFGPMGILANDAYLSTSAISDSRIFNITVRHLLEHSGGWNRDIDCAPNPTLPYSFDFNTCDPIVFPLHVTQTLGEANPVSERALIKFLLQKGLNFTPGSAYAYSNIGYLVLGLVIEQKTGMTYEEYVKSAILSPLGICDMHLGNNLLSDKFEREGEYTENCCSINSCYGDGTFVTWQYGGLNVEAMDAHGGWIATARDLVRLIGAIDGFNTKPNILQASTIAQMTTPSATNSFYAKGWSVNAANNWWHFGALDGTASFMARTEGGYSWAIILNRRVIGVSADNFWADFDALPWNCIASVSSWPTYDLMEFPTLSASTLLAQNITPGVATLVWTNGNGSQRLVVAREKGANDAYPKDGVDYGANDVFGNGDNLGQGNFVVFNGTSNSVALAGLDPLKEYVVTVYEYNQNGSTGNNALYRLCDAPHLNFKTVNNPASTISINFTAYDCNPDGTVNFHFTATGLKSTDNGFAGYELKPVGSATANIVLDCQGIPTGLPCPLNYDPVCGCNGIDYSNDCFAGSAGGVAVLHPGSCTGDEIIAFTAYNIPIGEAAQFAVNVQFLFALPDQVLLDQGTFLNTLTVNCNTACSPITNLQTEKTGHSYISIKWDDTGQQQEDDYIVRHRKTGASTWEMDTIAHDYGGGGVCFCPGILGGSGFAYRTLFVNRLMPCAQFEFQINKICKTDLGVTTGESGWTSSFTASTTSCDNPYFTASCYPVPEYGTGGCATLNCVNLSDLDFCAFVDTASGGCAVGFGDEGYNLHKNDTARVNVGATYPMNLKFAKPGIIPTFPQGWFASIWIDWNQDLDFADNSENYGWIVPISDSSFTTNIDVPATATLGTSHLRIVFSEDKNATSCGLIKGGGIVRDFPIKIGMTVATNGLAQAENRIRIYPNPASKSVFIESKDPVPSIQIWSMVGGLIAEIPVFGEAVDVSFLPDGGYLVKANGQFVKLMVLGN